MSSDPLGHKLLEERVRQCTLIIESMLEVPVKTLLPFIPDHFVVTGTGSSESHAKYFVSLINQFTPVKATFVPLSAFFSPIKADYRKSTLVIFSQGISSNSMLALWQRERFEHTVLFTSTTLEGSSKPGKEKKHNLLLDLIADEQTIVHFPIEDEYDLLIRVIGPMAGYLAAIQFINVHWPEALPSCPQSQLLTALNQAEENIPPAVIGDLTEDCNSACTLLTADPFSGYAQNLAYKFLEGLFLPLPNLVDVMSFSHGPFQRLVHSPSPVIILDTDSREDEQLFLHINEMLESAKVSTWRITSKVPLPWTILEYEAILNQFLLKTIESYNANQRDWPGKGKDGPLYNIDEPMS